MNRRGFFTACASLLPLPAFVRAASLWLPPERPRIVEPVINFDGEHYFDSAVIFVPDGPGIKFQAGPINEALLKEMREFWDVWKDLSMVSYRSAMKEPE